ncbi:MAG: hypothetical protein RL199_770 [Pseudomonadota bacterium]|jgi:ABC-type uncharacterized transport system involved in gliding motility auxiliary subunit
MSKTVGRVIGPLGALFILFALFARLFITGEFNAVVWGQLLLGLGGVGVWAATAFDDARNVATGRGTVFVAMSTVATLLVLGLLGAANYTAVKKKKEWDLTKASIHTLAEQTTGLLKGLTPERKVKVTAFYQPMVDREYAPLEDLLKRYKSAAGDNLEFEFVDAAKNPQLAKTYNVNPQSPRIILKSADGKESRAKEVSEEALTNALAELGRGLEKKVYFLAGHGEKTTSDKGAETAVGLKLWTDGLSAEGFKSEELNLLTRKDVPEDALVVVVAGPQTPLADGERDALQRYANGGGRLVVLVDPGLETNLDALLSGWGVSVGKGIVVDPESQEALWAFTQDFAEHPLSTPRMTILGAMPFIFPEARGVRQGIVGEGFSVTELFKTGKNAWGETSPLPADGRVVRDDADEPGPVSLAVAVTKKLESGKELRAVVVGDSDWASNQFIRQGGNRDLALNTVQWLSGEDNKITIRPKLREKSSLAFLTADQRLLLSFGSLNVLPLLLIGFGLSIWSVRRSK